jgi:hypothetical protein
MNLRATKESSHAVWIFRGWEFLWQFCKGPVREHCGCARDISKAPRFRVRREQCDRRTPRHLYILLGRLPSGSLCERAKINCCSEAWGEKGARERTNQQLTLGGHQLPATDQSVASFSSRTRMPFRRVGKFGNGGHWRRRAARQTDASNLVRKAASRNSLLHPFIAISPRIEPSVEEWFRLIVQQTLKRR